MKQACFLSNYIGLPDDFLSIKGVDAGGRPREARVLIEIEYCAMYVGQSSIIARRTEMGDVQLEERAPLRLLQRPKRIDVLVPINETYEEIGLRRPDGAV